MRLPLRFTPAKRWSPLVISFPHVGLSWPPDLRPKPQVDFARNADYAVQTLYTRALEAGAATVEAVYSRLVVDLNRARDDVSTELVPDHPAPQPRRRPGDAASDLTGHGHALDRPGRGVVWASAVGHANTLPIRILEGPLAYRLFNERIERFHDPYYRVLSVLLERRKQRFGYAILLDAHSMPGTVGADLVLGTLGGSSCDPSLETLALEALRSSSTKPARRGRRLSARLNDPYQGGQVVRRFGRPSEGLHALQLEVNRGLYMDETTSTLWDHPPSDLDPEDLRGHDPPTAENSRHATQGGEPPTQRPPMPQGADDHPRGAPTGRGPDRGPNLGVEGTRQGDATSSADPFLNVIERRSKPNSRQARDLAELLGRVTSLVEQLASSPGDPTHGLGSRSGSPATTTTPANTGPHSR